MGAEVEVEFGGVSDSDVDGCSRRDVEGLSDLVLLVHGEETRVVTLLDSDESDSRLVAALQHHAGLSHCSQLVLEDLNNGQLKGRQD